jgi:hypothetical protein
MPLIAHYKLLSDASDSCGRGHNGAATNVSYVPGKIGQAASFAGNGVIRVADAADLNVAADLTVALWCRVSSLTNNAVLVAQYDSGANQRSWMVRIQFDDPNSTAMGAVQFWASSSGLYTPGYRLGAYTTTARIHDGNWHHVVWTFDAGIVSCWIDGASAALSYAFQDGITSFFNATCDLTIGARLNQNAVVDNFIGLVDDVRLYNEALPDWKAWALDRAGAGSERCEPWQRLIIPTIQEPIRSLRTA